MGDDTKPVALDCRSPCGERGLKCEHYPDVIFDVPSLPVRGAWIEISSRRLLWRDNRSLPVRGAWIEMSSVGITSA